MRQFDFRKPRRRARDQRSLHAQALLPPSVELTAADPMLAGDLRRRQIRTEALRNDLVFLLSRPRPSPFAPRDDLYPQVACAPTTGRMSALTDRPNIKRFFHRELAAQPTPAPPYVAAATLTQSAVAAFVDRLPVAGRLRATAPTTRCRSQPTAACPVLAPLKDASRRQRRSPAAILDRRSARQPHQDAGRDGRMAPPGAEPKNASIV